MAKREFLVKLSVDEDLYEKATDGKIGIGDYLEEVMEKVSDMGVKMENWMITDADDELQMQRYANYLIDWVFANARQEEPASPNRFYEWKDPRPTPNKGILYYPQEDLEELNNLMQAREVDYAKHGIKPYSTVIRWSVSFIGGYEMDVMVCSYQDGTPLGCQAVLFLNNDEVACTDIEMRIDKEWSLSHNGRIFTVALVKN